MTDLTIMSDEGLRTLHGSIIKCIELDDQAVGEKPFNVRGTADWKSWASMLEGEMTMRGVVFRQIPW